MIKIRTLINLGMLAGIAAYIGLYIVNINQQVDNLPKVNSVLTNGVNEYDSLIRLYLSDRLCSGVVIDGTYALTAAHCVQDVFGNMIEEEITIFDVYDNPTGTHAKAVALDSLRDVALIKGNFINFKSSQVDFDGTDVSNGMVMYSCGFPSGQKKFCTTLIHAGNRFFQYRTIGGPIYKGCSGGPVYNMITGRVVGINSAVDEDYVIVGPLVGLKGILGL